MKRNSGLLLSLFFISAGLFSCFQDKGDRVAESHPAIYATLFQQQAAEYRALCYQAFNVARLRLDQQPDKTREKPLAVILDIDETVLDNSPYQAGAILGRFEYPERWAEWMEMASARPVPGALEFLLYAGGKGVEVFYVTNRREIFRAATLENLVNEGFPFADDEHLLMRTESNDKEERREKVMAGFHVVLLIGDNLGDFSSVFESTDVTVRSGLTDEHREAFGERFIVLPNTIYGSWLDVLEYPGQKADAEDPGAGPARWLEGF